MRRFTMLPAILAAVAMAAAGLACDGRPDAGGEADDRGTPADTTPSAEPVDTGGEPGPAATEPGEAADSPPAPAGDTVPQVPGADLHGYDTVFVYFDGPMPDGVTEGPLVPRPRAVPDTGALAFALAELLAGPTPADEADGPLYSWFSGETAGMLRRVGVEDGVAIVELGDFRSIIPGASSSAGSASLLRQLKATVFQFPEVRRVEFRIDGSCEAFMAWLQIGCVPIPRSSFEPPDGYRTAVPADAAGP